MKLIERAIALAAIAHGDSVDKGGAPYILHPLRVMFKLEDETARIVAVLHDIVEDTGVTLEGLRAEGFSEEVVAAVDAISKREGEGYFDYLGRVAGNDLARRVKLADLYDNTDPARAGAISPEKLAKYDRAIRFLVRG